MYSDSYMKRIKIFDSKNWWIDTSPQIINEVEKSLRLYDLNKFLITYEIKKRNLIIYSNNNKDLII